MRALMRHTLLPSSSSKVERIYTYWRFLAIRAEQMEAYTPRFQFRKETCCPHSTKKAREACPDNLAPDGISEGNSCFATSPWKLKRIETHLHPSHLQIDCRYTRSKFRQLPVRIYIDLRMYPWIAWNLCEIRKKDWFFLIRSHLPWLLLKEGEGLS